MGVDGGVPELADGQDLGSCAARREGSSPSFPSFVILLRNSRVQSDSLQCPKSVLNNVLLSRIAAMVAMFLRLGTKYGFDLT